MSYWSAIDILKQAAGELGLSQPAALPTTDVQTNRLLALLNAAGNEMMLLYPWENMVKTWEFDTVDGQGAYDVPSDWGYFVDQTQWDKTNRWPLLGPKSPQEWAWLKSGIVAAAPRMRYRVFDNKLNLHPVPGSTPFTLRLEYIVNTWVQPATGSATTMINSSGDTVLFQPWLMIKFLKLKFQESSGLDATASRTDFTRLFNSLTGKAQGAPKLSLAPRMPPIFIGPWSIPDGSWDVTP